ncbi:hypothetical protein DUI87_13084 [Hirundo rustica rustica]|uniref:Uncharacterized protein n=1 Tax=Hirundo rustica rustica TaxID=333673 RepID=A0A3M0KAX0_HIRRU|nr:hypothetical protein DUI87_13084 [Hirundo rustica rustica]
MLTWGESPQLPEHELARSKDRGQQNCHLELPWSRLQAFQSDFGAKEGRGADHECRPVARAQGIRPSQQGFIKGIDLLDQPHLMPKIPIQ